MTKVALVHSVSPEIYDEINMGTENFVVSIFQNFFHRYPTAAELYSASNMVDGNQSTIFNTNGSSKKDFIERRPRKRPVFVSSTLHPKIARTLVNLSQVKKGDKIYDPFCGIGGILIEGGLLEIDTIGSEISYTRIIGAKKNLEWQRITNSELILTDSLLLPIRKVDAVVTDIPYGRSTFTQGYNVSEIYMKLLMICSEMLKINGFLVVLHPKENIFPIPSNLNLRIMEKYEIPVHRSLTRIITVYKRVN